MTNRFVRTLGAFALFGGVLLGASPSFAGGTSVFATPDCSLNDNGWCLGGADMAGYASAITNPTNFGAGGVVSTAISIQQLSAVNASTLAGANVFVAPWWENSESASSTTAVLNFFHSGGSLFLLDDDSAHDGIGAALGLPTSGSTGSPSNGNSALTNGPFGVATNITQEGDVGFLDEATVLADGGKIGSTNAEGQVTSAYWAPGAFGAGDGALVILADVDMISSAYGNVSYSPLNGNGIFALNTTAFLTSSAVPEPFAWTMMLAGFAMVGGMMRLSNRKRAPAVA